jgi:dipeptidyl aminopeptidase/acylaminoacyl peptidase
MKKLFWILTLVLNFVAGTSAAGQQPPLVDRSLFFGEIQIAGAQISPDGQYISFLKPYKGTRNIWVKKATEPFSAARPVSAEAQRPIRNYFWSWDSKYILYSQDAGGDENFNVYAIDPALPADPKTGVPPTRALTNLKGVRTEIFAAPKSKPDILFIGLNDRDPRWHDLYELHISTGNKQLLRKNTENIAGWDFDHEGSLRLAERTNQAGDTEILRVDPDGFKLVYGCSVLENCGVEGFDAENKQAYLITNKGSLNLTELEEMNLANGQIAKIESDPENKVDLDSFESSEIDYHIFFTRYEDDRSRLYFRDKEFEKEYRWLQSKLPGKEITFAARSRDENVWIVSAHSDTEPGETYVWDRKAQTLALQYRIREELPREALSPMTSIHYKSSDGLEIPAYLTLPKGLPAKNLPLIVFPHGGPWARD